MEELFSEATYSSKWDLSHDINRSTDDDILIKTFPNSLSTRQGEEIF